MAVGGTTEMLWFGRTTRHTSVIWHDSGGKNVRSERGHGLKTATRAGQTPLEVSERRPGVVLMIAHYSPADPGDREWTENWWGRRPLSGSASALTENKDVRGRERKHRRGPDRDFTSGLFTDRKHSKSRERRRWKGLLIISFPVVSGGGFFDKAVKVRPKESE